MKPRISRSSKVVGIPGQPRHLVACDGCGFEIAVVAGATADGQANRKLVAAGWRIGRKRHCPDCIAAERRVTNETRPPQEPKPMTQAAVTPIAPAAPRAPSLTDRRRIMEALEGCYDRNAGRYVGSATDATIAKGLGDIPTAWVSDLREMLFGPHGDNDDMENLVHDLGELHARLTKNEAEMLALAERSERDRAEIPKMHARLEAIRRAVGPQGDRL